MNVPCIDLRNDVQKRGQTRMTGLNRNLEPSMVQRGFPQGLGRFPQSRSTRANSDDCEAGISVANGSADQPKTDEQAAPLTLAMTILKAAVVYFALVFGAGFLLGFIRVLFAVPRVGERMAELLEAPVMLAVIILAAYWIVRRFQLQAGVISRLGVGLIAFTIGFSLSSHWY